MPERNNAQAIFISFQRTPVQQSHRPMEKSDSPSVVLMPDDSVPGAGARRAEKGGLETSKSGKRRQRPRILLRSSTD